MASRAHVPATRRRTRGRWLALLGGTGYVVLAVPAARDPQRWERRSFRELNHAGGAVPVLRLPQQLGTPWVLPALGLVGTGTHRPHLAVSSMLALPVEKSLEVGIKKVADRRRPAQAQPAAQLRDDAPAEGPSYPSGHAAPGRALPARRGRRCPARARRRLGPQPRGRASC
ncbi:MAG TPA: hypothetical protein VFG63_06865 [Nocardioidaceae bacterium]|nr:hypothetical protein [Nocardioidaceae bacterium]